MHRAAFKVMHVTFFRVWRCRCKEERPHQSIVGRCNQATIWL